MAETETPLELPDFDAKEEVKVEPTYSPEEVEKIKAATESKFDKDPYKMTKAELIEANKKSKVGKPARTEAPENVSFAKQEEVAKELSDAGQATVKPILERAEEILKEGEDRKVPKLEIVDGMPFVESILTPAAKELMKRRANSTVIRLPSGETINSVYLSLCVREGQEQKGYEKIAELVNEMAAGEYHLITLAPISSIKLGGHHKGMSAVFAFVLGPAAFCDKWRESPYSTPEGGIGPIL